MGKTVPSYRMALEFEIERWKPFRKALQCEEEREAFDELMDMCRSFASESSNATNPVIFEPLLGSVPSLSQPERSLNLQASAIPSA